VFVWPDGDFCDRSDIEYQMDRSDDFDILYVDSDDWIYFDPERPLRRWRPST